MTTQIIVGDCRDVLQNMIDAGPRVETVLTDPPYHLASIVKRFGKKGSAPAKFGTDGRFTRASEGFREQTWDGADGDGVQIAHDPRFWRLCFDVLKPGGFCLAFSSPMTGHRMACAMEDAGFTMHPFIAWIYSGGFPKAHEVGPTWPGWYHSTQTLNPACNPVYVAQRPPEVRPMAKNAALHGVGGMNIEAGRVRPARQRRDLLGDGPRIDAKGVELTAGGDLARWPSNVAHDGGPDVLKGFPVDSKGQSAARYYNEFPPFVFHAKTAKADKVGPHPTQKPPGLLCWLARLTTPPGGTILDPFAGTGTMGAAAEAEGFNSILIEQDASYVKSMRKRLGVARDLMGD